MKSVDPGILSKSVCFSFQPADFALENLNYLTWCGHYYCTDRYYIQRATYPYLLLIFVREGKMSIEYDEKKFIISKGDVLMIDCRYPHYYRAHNGLEFFYLHFDGINSHEVSRFLLHKNGGPVFRQPQNVSIGKELYDCVEFYKQGNIGNMFQESQRIHKLFYQLSVVKTTDVQESSPVEQAIQYIQKNVGKNISLHELALVVKLSPYYFAHIFKKQTGYAPAEYILKTRLEKARLLLVHSQKSVSEIAYEVGYSSLSAFVNIFTRKVGLSPKPYRMLEKGNLKENKIQQD